MWSDRRTTVAEMRMAVDAFVGERDWRRYHTPVNLASAMVVEAAELLELFQWRRDGDPVPEDVVTAAAEELADVLHYALALANATEAKLPIDDMTLNQACERTDAWLLEPGEGAGKGSVKRTVEQVVSSAAVVLGVVRLSELGDREPAGSVRGPPSEVSDMAEPMEDLFNVILQCARDLGIDLSRELDAKMGKNKRRFPVGSKPDVGY